MMIQIKCLFYHNWVYEKPYVTNGVVYNDYELVRICKRCYKKMGYYSDLDDSYWRTIPLNKDDIRDKKLKDIGI